MTNSEAAKCIEHIRFYMEGGECWTDAEFEAMDMAIEALRSATDINVATKEPKIIRCKDCKHRPTPTRADEGITYGFSVEFPDEKCPCRCEDGWYNWYPKNDFYCGYAERRGE